MYSRRIDGNLCFMLDFIQIINDVVALGYRPNIHSELCYTSVYLGLKMRVQDGVL